jgi:hypothetical protein
MVYRKHWVYLNEYKDFIVDEKQPQVISCKVSAEEAEAIKARAAALEISVSEYVRTRALSDPLTANRSVEESLRYIIYLIENLHLSTYLIAEKSAFLQPQQLHEILKDATRQAALHAHQLDSNFARLRDLIAAFSKADAQENG